MEHDTTLDRLGEPSWPALVATATAVAQDASTRVSRLQWDALPLSSEGTNDLSTMVHYRLEATTSPVLTCMMEASCMHCSPAGAVPPVPSCAAGPAAAVSSLAEAA